MYVLCGAAFWVMGSVLYHRLDVCYYPAVVVLLGTVVTRKLARPQGCLLWGLLAQVLIFAFVNTLLTPRTGLRERYGTLQNTLRETIRPDAAV